VWQDGNDSNQPRDAVVIPVTGSPIVMRVVKEEFTQQLKARGINAMPGDSLLPSDQKLEKEGIAAAVKNIHAGTSLSPGSWAHYRTEPTIRATYLSSKPACMVPAGGIPLRGYASYQAMPGCTVEQNILSVEPRPYDVNTDTLIRPVTTETVVGDPAKSGVKGVVTVIMKSHTECGLVARP
jgi:hypothetical protein